MPSSDTRPVPSSELTVTFARSSGPGGQNVNKVNTKACVRWFFEETVALGPEARSRLRQIARNQIASDGAIILVDDSTRSQRSNLEACYQKIRQLIARAKRAPKTRKKTKPSRAAKERRLTAKKIVSAKKAFRDKTKPSE